VSCEISCWNLHCGVVIGRFLENGIVRYVYDECQYRAARKNTKRSGPKQSGCSDEIYSNEIVRHSLTNQLVGLDAYNSLYCSRAAPDWKETVEHVMLQATVATK